LTYDEVLDRKLMVMDATAIVLCRDQNMPIMVFDITRPGGLLEAVEGKDIGTVVERG
jgi:uridylate kinase